jgi:hypothetical protein
MQVQAAVHISLLATHSSIRQLYLFLVYALIFLSKASTSCFGKDESDEMVNVIGSMISYKAILTSREAYWYGFQFGKQFLTSSQSLEDFNKASAFALSSCQRYLEVSRPDLIPDDRRKRDCQSAIRSSRSSTETSTPQ